jgi:hypothetical protein
MVRGNAGFPPFVVFLTALAFLATGTNAMASEELPKYEVVEREDDADIEIRTYAPMILAEVTVSGDRETAASRAFQILAGFIFGDNTSDAKMAMTAPVTQAPAAPSEKIAMTAPVTQTPAGGNAGDDQLWNVAFMMPSKYTIDTLPTPNDARIRIFETERRRAATIRFSGRWTQANMEKHAARLEAFLAEREMKTEGAPVYAFYDAPFKPFFLRRNEIIRYLAD